MDREAWQATYSPCGRKESDTTERINSTDTYWGEGWTQSCLRNRRNRSKNSPWGGRAAARHLGQPGTLLSQSRCLLAAPARRLVLARLRGQTPRRAHRGCHPRPPLGAPATSEVWKHPPGVALMAWLGLSAEASAGDEQGGGAQSREDTERMARAAGGGADGRQTQVHVVPAGWAVCSHVDKHLPAGIEPGEPAGEQRGEEAACLETIAWVCIVLGKTWSLGLW